jgi:predicted GH43/DUF377 family glycosyl hydrolase
MKPTAVLWLVLIAAFAGSAAAAERDNAPLRQVIPASEGGQPVAAAALQRVYDEVKTPCKYGIVIRGEGGNPVDCPSVFRYGGKWFMMYVIYDKQASLGYPFVMFYNAKSASGYERMGMAVSHDMQRWLRFGQEPIIDNGSGISGDPQVVRVGDVWVMFYFGAFWKPKAFDTFACSYDLLHWTKWSGPHLIEPSEPWDQTYAHKPWLVKHNGVVYHYYCAVGDQGRVIALATSKKL